MNKYRVHLFATAFILGVIAPAGAQEKGPDDWQYTFAVYLWGYGVEGNVGVGPVTAPVNITFSDALDNLASAVPLHFEAQKNQWGFLLDFMHLGLDPSASLPGGASLNVDLTDNIFELGGIYQPANSRYFQLLFGVRYSQFKLEGNVPGVASRTIVDENWTDGFVGGRFIVPFGNKNNWRFRARGDIGAGDSDFVWKALLGIDYRFSNRIVGLLGYRWLHYDLDNGESGRNRFTYDVTYEGPAAALIFTW